MMEDIALTFLQDLQAHGTPKDLDLLLVNTDGDDKSLTLKKLAQYVNTEITYPDATLNNKGITKLSNATNSNDETTAATPKAVTAAVKNATIGLARMSEGAGWRKDENTGFIIQWGQTVTTGINESTNLWQSFNVPFHQGVGAILLTPYWPGRNSWDDAYDYAPLLGGYGNDGFNWNKQSFGHVRMDFDSGMHWFAIGK